jgi:hypothetical protein
MDEKVYLIKLYYEEEKFKSKMQEYIFKCTREDVEKFTKQEIGVFEKRFPNMKITDVVIFEKIMDYK